MFQPGGENESSSRNGRPGNGKVQNFSHAPRPSPKQHTLISSVLHLRHRTSIRNKADMATWDIAETGHLLACLDYCIANNLLYKDHIKTLMTSGGYDRSMNAITAKISRLARLYHPRSGKHAIHDVRDRNGTQNLHLPPELRQAVTTSIRALNPSSDPLTRTTSTIM